MCIYKIHQNIYLPNASVILQHSDKNKAYNKELKTHIEKFSQLQIDAWINFFDNKQIKRIKRN